MSSANIFKHKLIQEFNKRLHNSLQYAQLLFIFAFSDLFGMKRATTLGMVQQQEMYFEKKSKREKIIMQNEFWCQNHVM